MFWIGIVVAVFLVMLVAKRAVRLAWFIKEEWDRGRKLWDWRAELLLPSPVTCYSTLNYAAAPYVVLARFVRLC